MAEIVLGLGTSHGSQVSLTPDWWSKHGELDRKRTRYEELLKSDARPGDHELTPEVYQRKYDAVQDAVAVLASTLTESALDAVVVIGDDQGELYAETNIPAMAVYWGDSVLDIPRDLTDVPESRAAAMWAKHSTVEEAYPVEASLGKHVIESGIDAGFDLAQMREQPVGRSIGHAFTFVRLRLMKEHVVPMVPILLNTYFPPNQPTAHRCFDFGEVLGQAIASWPGGRVGVVASEIKNWIVAAGALQHLDFEAVDYVPGYRSAAGTGCGMAFSRWR